MSDEKEKCPSCRQVSIEDRQESRPHLCRWCGYNYITNKPAGFVPASDPFAHLDDASDHIVDATLDAKWI